MMKETKYISEVEYLTFKNGLRGVIIKMIIGFVIGLVLGLCTEESLPMSILTGILWAGIPYAWSVIPFCAIGWWAIILKFMLAAALGWLITPIVFVYNYIQMKRYEAAVQEHIIELGE